MAKSLNLGLTAWSPLARGVLTGKYHGHASPEQSRMNSDTMKDFMPEQQRIESEDYMVDLKAALILELTIDPDRGAGEALAQLADWRLA